MTAVGQNLTLYAGDDEVIRFSLINEATSTALDLTGVSQIKWSLLVRVGEAFTLPAALSKTLSSGIAITNVVGGIIEVTIADTDTQSLSPRTYEHQLEITDSAGNKKTAATGSVILEADGTP